MPTISASTIRSEVNEAIPRLGVKEVGRRLCLGPIPVLRLAAGETVRKATIELARINLPRLSDPEHRAP